MNRKILVSLAMFVAVIALLAGFRTAIEPHKFTGTWYAAGTGEQFIFSEGIIESGEITVQDPNRPMTGAYIFSGKHILLFCQCVNGVEEVKLLDLIHLPTGDALCEKQNTSNVIFFFRNKEEAILIKTTT